MNNLFQVNMNKILLYELQHIALDILRYLIYTKIYTFLTEIYRLEVAKFMDQLYNNKLQNYFSVFCYAKLTQYKCMHTIPDLHKKISIFYQY